MKAFTTLPWAALAFALLAGCSPKQEPAKPVKPTVEAAPRAPSATPEAIAAATPEATAAATPAPLHLPALGPAPGWQLKDVNGRPVSSDEFKGKVMVVDFWATWCPPCRSEIPVYADLQRKYGRDKLAIIGVSLDEAGPEVVKEFVQKFGVDYQIVMGDETVQTAFGGMDAIPTTFLIDRDGQIRDKKVGAEPTAEYARKIEALLDSGDHAAASSDGAQHEPRA